MWRPRSLVLAGCSVLAGGIGTNSRGQHSICPDLRPAGRLPYSAASSAAPHLLR